MRHLKLISYRGTTCLVIRLGYLVPICALCKTCWVYDLINSYSHIGDRWDIEVDLPHRMSFRNPMGACRSPLKRHLPGSCPLWAVVQWRMQKLQDWVVDKIFGYVFLFHLRLRLRNGCMACDVCVIAANTARIVPECRGRPANYFLAVAISSSET